MNPVRNYGSRIRPATSLSFRLRPLAGTTSTAWFTLTSTPSDNQQGLAFSGDEPKPNALLQEAWLRSGCVLTSDGNRFAGVRVRTSECLAMAR